MREVGWVGIAGFALGFFVSIPPTGPVAMLVVARSLEGRAGAAMALGAGAALSEAAYAFLAYASFNDVLADHPLVASVSRAALAAFLIGFAVMSARGRPDPVREPPLGGVRGSLATGFLISALNPTLVLSWAVVLGVLSAANVVALPRSGAFAFSLGVAGGIACWFVLAGAWIERRRTNLSGPAIAMIQRGMSALAFALGLAIAATL